jgi:hypothetical protein
MPARESRVWNFQPQPDAAIAPGAARLEVYAERFRLVAELLFPSNTRRELG